MNKMQSPHPLLALIDLLIKPEVQEAMSQQKVHTYWYYRKLKEALVRLKPIIEEKEVQ